MACPAVSSASAKLTEFVTQGNQQVNYSAQAMRMLDLKSTVMWLMMEHMGLIGETHTYDLRNVSLCPARPMLATFITSFCKEISTRLLTIQAPYVNGTLLTYQIGDLCPQFRG